MKEDHFQILNRCPLKQTRGVSLKEDHFQILNRCPLKRTRGVSLKEDHFQILNRCPLKRTRGVIMIKVLIVDDDKLTRKGLETLLPWEACNMTVIGSVQNGSMALEFLEKENADLLFVDIEMPVMNGIELMEICKQKYPGLQFVVLTFYEKFAYAKSAVKLGVLDYISKIELDPDEGSAVLQNIYNKYMERSLYDANNGQSAPLPTPFNESLWENLKKEWSLLYWVYDKELLKELSCKTMEANPSLRHAELHLIKCLQRVDTEAGRKESEFPAFHTIQDMLSWLTVWLEELYEYVNNQDCYTNMLLCIIRSVQYMNTNIAQPLKAETVADMAGISRSYFSISFKKMTGQTFHDYLKSMRISLGKQLLRNTDKTVTDIAYCIGYNDVNYFNRVFLNTVQRSPSEYRKLSRSPERKDES